MGGVQSIDVPPRVVATGEPGTSDTSPVYRNLRCDMENGGDFIDTFRSQPDSRTPLDILRVSATKFATSDCTGERLIHPDGSAGSYKWTSYSDFYKQCLAMGRGMLSLGVSRGDKIGIYSANSQYWQMVAFGAYSVGLVVVPVYDSLGKDAAEYIIAHAEVKAVFCSNAKFKSTIDLIPTISATVKAVIILSDVKPNANTEFEVRCARDLLEIGFASDAANDFGQPDDIALIMYTSGSTGTPKGCVLTHRNIVAGASGLGCVNVSVSPSDTHLSFLPLAHIYAMAVELIMYAQGARVGFSRGIIKELVDDITALQPTVLIAVPRVLNKVVESMRAKIAALPKPLQYIMHLAITAKIAAMKRNKSHSIILDALLFAKFRTALGGRIRVIVSVGAPILPDVFEFLCATVCPNIVQGYGLTEVSSGLAVQEVPALDPRTVGASTIGCEIKLRSVPGTSYDPNGDPPAGELLVRGPCVFQCYYKQPELTAESLSDNWFATGDIVRFTPMAQIEIVDRAKQLVKLSQGEYLSMTTLNDFYGMADVASFVYVYANPRYDQPVAVVFPKVEMVEKWSKRGIYDVRSDETVHKEIIESLGRVWKERGMRGFERISYCVVDTVEPTIENGLLTPSMKPQYASLRRKYEDDLLALYEQKFKST
jgi:long-chain acyl-CoA synthetase